MPVSRSNMCNKHALYSLLAHGHTGLPYVMSTEFQWFHELWNFSKTQNEYKAVILYLWLSKQILRASSEDTFCLKLFSMQKEGNDFSLNNMHDKGNLNTLSYSLYSPASAKNLFETILKHTERKIGLSFFLFFPFLIQN